MRQSADDCIVWPKDSRKHNKKPWRVALDDAKAFLLLDTENKVKRFDKKGTHISVPDVVAEMCSFDSYAYFIKCFKRRFSLPPAQYRRANKAML